MVYRAGNDEYTVISQLGKGKGGYSYVAEGAGRRVVVKQIHYEPCDYFTFEDNKLQSELNAYAVLRRLGIAVPALYFSSDVGQFLIKEYIEGDTLDKIVADNGVTQDHFRQLWAMCDALYANNINIDYYPTNFVEQRGKLYYVDYEISPYSAEWNFENWGMWFLIKH